MRRLVLTVWLIGQGLGCAVAEPIEQQSISQRDHKPAAADHQWRAAAERGRLNAQRELGAALPGSAGLYWLKRAVREGSSNAAVTLAQRYYDNLQYHKAAQCWLWAAKQGNTEAQTRLGALQVVGLGLPKDQIGAYAWLNLAATNGSPDIDQLRATVGKQLSPEEIRQAESLSRDLPQSYADLPGQFPCGQ